MMEHNGHHGNGAGNLQIQVINERPALREVYERSFRRSADRVRIYIAEEQRILRDAYQTFFMSRQDMEVAGTSDDTSAESVTRAAQALAPDLVLIGIRVLQLTSVEQLEAVRESCPDVPIVLLSAYYDDKGMKALREFTRATTSGWAYLLKHNVDTPEQLAQVVQSVAQGRIILDPAVMAGLMDARGGGTDVLKSLDPREMEVLSWVAKGYTNSAIAAALPPPPNGASGSQPP
jgi:two-component system response regulator NreC